MGTGKLNVWISEIQRPCKITENKWWVTIFDCSGEVLEWPRDKHYLAIPAPEGHIEVALPPGTYRVMATGPIRFREEPWGRLLAVYNLFTDSSIVHVKCDQSTCVTLYPPSWHRCGFFIVHAVRVLAENKVIPNDVANNLAEAVKMVRDHLPKPTQADETEDFYEKLMVAISESTKDVEQRLKKE